MDALSGNHERRWKTAVCQEVAEKFRQKNKKMKREIELTQIHGK